MIVPIGGRTSRDDNTKTPWERRYSHVNHRDGPYPLVCVCETPEPEWVYVAHQCANCKRLIVDGAS